MSIRLDGTARGMRKTVAAVVLGVFTATVIGAPVHAAPDRSGWPVRTLPHRWGSTDTSVGDNRTAYTSLQGWEVAASSPGDNPTAYAGLQGWEVAASSPGDNPTAYAGLQGWEVAASSPGDNPTAYAGLQGWEVAASSPGDNPTAYAGLQGWEVAASSPGDNPTAYAGLQGWEVAQSGDDGLVAQLDSEPAPSEVSASDARTSIPDSLMPAVLLITGLLLGIAGTLVVGRIADQQSHA